MLKMPFLIAIPAAYFIGSIPSAVWVGFLFSGQDIRFSGSGNAGATNVFRVLGILPALLVFFLDFAKGAFVAWLCLRFGLSLTLTVLAAFFVILGHVYPILANFSGGKGIATAAGFITILDYWLFPVGLMVFVLVVRRYRLVSVASLFAVTVVFLITFFCFFFRNGDGVILAVMALFLAMTLLTHRGNLFRLMSGKEPKI